MESPLYIYSLPKNLVFSQFHIFSTKKKTARHFVSIGVSIYPETLAPPCGSELLTHSPPPDWLVTSDEDAQREESSLFHYFPDTLHSSCTHTDITHSHSLLIGRLTLEPIRALITITVLRLQSVARPQRLLRTKALLSFQMNIPHFQKGKLMIIESSYEV